MFSATFKVNNSLPSGTKISISASGKASDINSEADISATYSATLAAPLSSNANLRSLTVSNATLSPSFSTNITSYTTTVPFTVSSLNISAAPEDSAARVSISGNSLSVGRNTVSIKVTAASGATKTYTIIVTREQDPDYVASDNADLVSIAIDNGILSPEFQADRTGYVVYLPFEVMTFSVGGEPADSKALDVTGEARELSVGENLFTITVTAENGSIREYLVTAVRMPEYGVEPEPEEEIEEAEEEVTEEEAPEMDSEVEEEEEEEGNNPANPTSPLWLLILMMVIGLSLGYAGCYLLMIRGM